MIGGRGSSYIYLVLLAIIGGFLMAGGSRMENANYLTQYDNSKLTPTPGVGASIATPTPGVVGIPGAATATPTPTPTGP